MGATPTIAMPTHKSSPKLLSRKMVAPQRLNYEPSTPESTNHNLGGKILVDLRSIG